MAPSIPPGTLAASSANEPVRPPSPAEPRIVPCRSKPAPMALTLMVPALPPPAAAETSTIPPAPMITAPVSEVSLATPPSVKRAVSRNPRVVPPRSINEPSNVPTRTSPLLARAVSSPLGRTMSVSRRTAEPSRFSRAPSPPVEGSPGVDGRTRDNVPPAVRPWTAACSAVSSGDSTRMSPAERNWPAPTARTRSAALRPTVEYPPV